MLVPLQNFPLRSQTSRSRSGWYPSAVIEQKTLARCFGTGRFCLYGISRSRGSRKRYEENGGTRCLTYDNGLGTARPSEPQASEWLSLHMNGRRATRAVLQALLGLVKDWQRMRDTRRERRAKVPAVLVPLPVLSRLVRCRRRSSGEGRHWRAPRRCAAGT